MTIHVPIGEAKDKLPELVAAALRGEEVVLDELGVSKARIVPVGAKTQAEREEIVRRRRAAFGMFADKYRHLHGTGALDVPPSMTDDELDERFRRKFGPPSS